jgi:ABC-type Zn uptake system ZnuABC Zn-binding protein ZnuA
VAWVVVAISMLGGCGRERTAPDGAPRVGVTTSYLECAVRDLTPKEMPFRIVRLLPPGGCPGHFDVTPRMIDDLRGSRILFRFDFQAALDAKLGRLEAAGLTVVPIPVGDGMAVPATYAAACQAICQALSKLWPAEAVQFRSRLAAVRPRLDRLGRQCRQQVARAGLGGTKVLCSEHQTAFANWLGLAVVGTFPRGEAARFSEFVDSLTRGQEGHVKLVVANLQEGDRMARALAERLGVRMVPFSNFPSMAPGQQTFDELVQANVSALVESKDRTLAKDPNP